MSMIPEFQQCRDQPDLPHRSTQSVLVDNALYIGHPEKPVLYKYSISKKSWYTRPTDVSKYTLATYRSKVVLIGGKGNDGKYAEKCIRVLDDADLERKLNSSLTSAAEFKNACAATSDQNSLFVVCSDKLHVFNGLDWIHSSMKKSDDEMQQVYGNVYHALIHDGFIYMSVCPFSLDSSKLYRISPSADNFTESPTSFTREVMKINHQKMPNMTKVGDQIVTVTANGYQLEISAYSMLSQKWVEVEDLKLAFDENIVSAVGVPAFTSERQPEQLELWVVGLVSDHQSGVKNISVLKIINKSKFDSIPVCLRSYKQLDG